MNNNIHQSASNMTIRSIFSKAWSLVHGSKAAIWNIAILIMLVSITLEWIVNRILGFNSQHTHYFTRYIMLPILTNLLIAPFYAGSVMVAIQRARGELVNVKSGYQFFHRYIPIAITMVIVGFISNLIVMIINIPALASTLGRSLPFFDIISVLFSVLIYTFFILSIPMVIDKQYTPGQALSASVILVKPHWFRVFVIFILTYLCLSIATILLFLGPTLKSSIIMIIGAVIFIAAMIWLLPFLFLLIGVIYHRLLDR